MRLTPFFVYVLPVVTVLVLGLLGRTRRLGFLPTIVASIALTPAGGFVLALLSGPRRKRGG